MSKRYGWRRGTMCDDYCIKVSLLFVFRNKDYWLGCMQYSI